MAAWTAEDIVGRLEVLTSLQNRPKMHDAAHLCSNKWLEEGFGLREVSNELLSSLAMCGLEIMEVGNTYLADRLTADGSTIQSALDHTYFDQLLLAVCNVHVVYYYSKN